MPDTEQITLEIDERPAVAAVGRANSAIGGHEKQVKTFVDTAGKTWQSYGETVVRVNDKSKSSLDRLVQSMERQSAVAGKSGTERLIAERNLLIQKWGQEERAVQAITRAYDKMIAAESGGGGSKWQQFADQAKGFIQSPLQSIGNAAGGLLEKLGPVWTAVGAGAAILGSAAAAGWEAAKSLANYGLEIKNVELRTGLTTKEVGQFTFAARMAGQEVSIYERMMKGLSQAADEESAQGEKARTTLRKMGVDLHSAAGEMKPTSQLLLEISAGLGKLPEGVQRDAAAMDLFKKIGIEAIPVISGLNENVKRAKELGLGATDEDLARWEKYHQNVTEAEVLWEQFTRKIKEPLAAVVTFLFKDRAGNEYSLSDLQKRGVNLGQWAPRSDWQQQQDAKNAGFGTGSTWMTGSMVDHALGYTGKIEERKRADAAVLAFQASEGLAGQLKKAEAEFSKMVKPQVGVSSVQDVSDYGAAEKKIQGIKNQIEAGKHATEELKRFRADAAAFDKRGDESELTALGKIYFQRDLLLVQAAKVKASEAEIAGIRKAADEQAGAAARKDLAAFEDYDAKRRDQQFKEQMKPGGMMARLAPGYVSPEQIKDAKEWEAAQGQIDTIDMQARMETLNREAGQAQKLVSLSGMTGMDAIRAAYQIRIDLAKELAAVEAERISHLEKAADRSIGIAHAQKDLQKEIAEAQEEAAMKQLELQKQQMDELKKQSEGLWSTLLTHPRDFGKQLSGTLHEALIKPVAEGMSGITANLLKPVVYGADGQGGLAGMFKGIFGGHQDPMKMATDLNTAMTAQNSAVMATLTAVLAGAMGMSAPAIAAPSGVAGLSLPAISAPAVAGSSAAGGAGDFGGGGNPLAAMLGGGGSGNAVTPPFMGGGAAGAPSGGFGGWAGMLKNWKGMNWGGLTRADAGGLPGVDGQPGVDLGNTGKITGVNGAAGAALFAGGAMLAQQGLLGSSRGTWGGVAMGALGGAAIGFQMGGPIGAAIGGAAGALIGIGEKIAGVETPENEAKRLVKSIYGLTIDSSTAKQIAALAKQNYGGTVSVAVRSPEVRQLLQLVAESTGQKSNLFLNDPHGVNLLQQSGVLHQSAVYNNGTPYTYASNLPVSGQAGSTIPTGNPYAGGFTVMVSPEQTANLWATGVAAGIAGSPRQVAAANVNGSTASSARVNGAIMMLAPDVGTL